MPQCWASPGPGRSPSCPAVDSWDDRRAAVDIPAKMSAPTATIRARSQRTLLPTNDLHGRLCAENAGPIAVSAHSRGSHARAPTEPGERVRKVPRGRQFRHTFSPGDCQADVRQRFAHTLDGSPGWRPGTPGTTEAHGAGVFHETRVPGQPDPAAPAQPARPSRPASKPRPSRSGPASRGPVPGSRVAGSGVRPGSGRWAGWGRAACCPPPGTYPRLPPPSVPRRWPTRSATGRGPCPLRRTPRAPR
jgi:hypothetical protein